MGHILPGMFGQWPGHTREVLHESPIVGRQFSKHLDFQDDHWLWPAGYGGYLVQITLDPLVTDNVVGFSGYAIKFVQLSDRLSRHDLFL